MKIEAAPRESASGKRYRRAVFIFSATILFGLGGCATHTTASGGRETSVLGGAVTVATQSFQPPPPATLNVDTSKMIGNGVPSGNKVSLLWGLITLHDY